MLFVDASIFTSRTISIRGLILSYYVSFDVGFKVKAWPLGSAGLCLDREWAVVNAVTGENSQLKFIPCLHILCLNIIHFYDRDCFDTENAPSTVALRSCH
jgi:hypothetical protein